MSHRFLFVKVLAWSLLVFSLVQAQDQGGRRSNEARDRAGAGQDERRARGNFDPAQMRERWMNTIKEQLGASEDEWKALQPKLDKVMTAQREARSGSGGFGGFSGRSRGGEERDRPRTGDQPESKVAAAQRELRATLDNKSASTDDIATKLKAFRDAREKARAELQAAQKALREGLTPRHEATLVLLGILE